MRHIIAFVTTIIFALVYWVAYVSGENGWLWSAVGLILIYIAVYNLVEA